MTQAQRIRRDDIERRRRLPLAGQDVEHDVATDRAADERFTACGFDRVDAVAGDRGQDADHLAIAIGMAGKPAAHPLDRWRQRPVLERRAVAGTVRNFVCGRAVEHYAAMARMKRSPKMTANCALAIDHSRGGIFHSFSDRFKIR